MLKKMFEEKLKKVKPKKMEELEVGGSKEHYPNFYLSSDTLPEIKEWEVGKEYYLVLKVEQKSKNMRTEGKEEKYNADFGIKEIGCLEEESNTEDKKEQLKSKYLS